MPLTHALSRSRCLAVGITVGCLLLPATAAQAASVSVVQATKSVTVGKRASIVVAAAGANSCKLSAGRTRQRVSFAPGQRAGFIFTVTRRTRAGRYPLTVVCGDAKVTRRLRVKGGSGTTRRLVLKRVHAAAVNTPTSLQPTSQPDQTTQTTDSTTDTSAQPQTCVDTRDCTVDSEPVTRTWNSLKAERWEATPSPGECVHYAYARRPDVVERAERWHIKEWINAGMPNGAYGGGQPTAMGDAWTWSHAARRAGMQVTSTPAVGNIVVWQRGAGASDAYGHVAYVEEVAGDGSFRVSEMNAAGGPGVVTERWIAAADIAAYGIEFIP